MSAGLQNVVVLALCVGVISLTLTKASIFAGLRRWLLRTRVPVLGSLFECPYCMAHWVSLVLMFLYRPTPIESGNRWADLTVSWAALVAMGAVVAGGIYRLMGPED